MNVPEDGVLNRLTRSEHEPPEQYLLGDQERTDGQYQLLLTP